MIEFLTAVTETVSDKGSAPDLTGIAAIVTAGVGIVGFLATLVRGSKNSKRVEEVEQAASYVEGFDALINRMQAEITDLHAQLEKMEAKSESEKSVFAKEVAELRAEVKDRRSELLSARSEYTMLKGEIRGFMDPKDYKRFTEQVERER